MSGIRYDGRVKWFKPEKGYGFVARQGEEKGDVFLHVNEIKKSGIDGEISVGDQLSFMVEKGPKGLRAVDIRRTDTVEEMQHAS